MVHQCDDQTGCNINHQRDQILTVILYRSLHQSNRIIFIQRIHILIIAALLHFHHRDIGHNPEHTIDLGRDDPGIILEDAGQNLHLILCKFSGAVEIILAVLDLFCYSLFFLYHFLCLFFLWFIAASGIHGL